MTATTELMDAGKRAMIAGRDVPWLLRTRAERWPDHPFLVWEPFNGSSATWTYERFRADVVAVAGALHERGAGAGDRVLIHLDNCPEFLLAWFACAELGAVAVSTNTRSVARDLAYFGDKVAPVAAITSPEHAGLIRETVTSASLLVVTDHDAGEPSAVAAGLGHVPFAELLGSEVTAPPRPVDPMADLGIQFTSGTTSRPKAVLWTHANAIWGAQVNVAHMSLLHEDVTLTFLPLFHTNAQSYSLLSTLWVGGTMVLQPQFSASRFWDVSVRHRVTWASMVPFCVKAILAHPVPPDHQYRFWAPAVRLADVEARVGIATMAWWGMTETITRGTVNSRDHPGPDLGIGRASPSYDISIRHFDGTQVEPGERGQLFIRGVPGVTMFKEYYGDPEATARAYDDDGWFDTGDVIVIDAHGDLFFADRDKDMLKVGGENVAASEIELVVIEAGLASECAVVGQPHEMLDEVPVIFVIPADGAPNDESELAALVIAACRANLADFKVPRAVHVVDDLPRSTLNKIAKNDSETASRPDDQNGAMRALQLTSWQHDPEFRQVAEPDPGPGEVVVRIGGAGVCHSDLHLLYEFPPGLVPYDPPFTLGHENAGWVEALGAGVTGLEIGEPVAVYGAWGCGHCSRCRVGMENYCANQAEIGTGGGGLGRDGGMAPLMLVPSARLLVPLGDLDPARAAPLTDAGLTPYHAIRRSLPKLMPGSSAVVIGVGGLGHLAVQMLAALTATQVIAVDQRPEALELAAAGGATVTVTAGDDAAAAVADATKGLGADLVLDVVGADATMQLAVQVARPMGDVTVVGIAGGTLPFGFFTVPYEVSLQTTYWGSIVELAEVLDLARRGAIHAEVTTYALDDAAAAYEALHSGTLRGRAVVVP